MIFVTFTSLFWQMVFSSEGMFFRVIKRWENGVRCKQTSLMLINVCKAIFIRRFTARSKQTKKSHVNWVCAACLYHLSRLHHHLYRLHRSWNNSTMVNQPYKIEPYHDRTNKMVCAPSKDSDQRCDQRLRCQPEKPLGPKLPNKTAKTQVSLGGYPGWSMSSLGAQVLL